MRMGKQPAGFRDCGALAIRRRLTPEIRRRVRDQANSDCTVRRTLAGVPGTGWGTDQSQPYPSSPRARRRGRRGSERLSKGVRKGKLTLDQDVGASNESLPSRSKTRSTPRPLVILAQSAVAAQPSERPLNDPPPRQHFELRLALGRTTPTRSIQTAGKSWPRARSRVEEDPSARSSGLDNWPGSRVDDSR